MDRIEALVALGFTLDEALSSPSPDKVKAAYRKACKQHHPDKGGSAEKMQELSEIYAFLMGKTSEPVDEKFRTILTLLDKFVTEALIKSEAPTIAQFLGQAPVKASFKSLTQATLIKSVEVSIKGQLDRIKQDMASCKGDKRALETTLGNITQSKGKSKKRSKNGKGAEYADREDFVSSIIKRRISEVDEALTRGEEMVDDLNILLDILDNYEYLVESPGSSAHAREHTSKQPTIDWSKMQW